MKERAARDPILFANIGTCSIGPEIVLEEIGLSYQLVPVNTRENQSRTADYLKINPVGQVPCLILWDRRILTEAAAIMLTFRQFRVDHPFASAWCDDRMSDLLRWMFFLSGSMTRGYSLFGRPDKFVSGAECQSDMADNARKHLHGMWNIVENSIEGQFFFREGYSVVDVFIVMQLLWDSDRPALLSLRPRLKGLFDVVTARPAVSSIVKRHSSAEFWCYDPTVIPKLSRELLK